MGGGAMPIPVPATATERAAIAIAIATATATATGADSSASLPHSRNLSSYSPANFPVSAAHSGASSSRPFSANHSSYEAETVSETGDNRVSVFGPIPSRAEVQRAICDLQTFMLDRQTSGLEWLQRKMNLNNPETTPSFGYNRVCDAFHLLRKEPSIQRMVTSIASDKAVWDAVMTNKAVQDLRDSLSSAKEEKPLDSSTQEPDLAMLIIDWILGFSKAKIMELVEKFSSLVTEIFQSPMKKSKPAAEITDEFDFKLRSSLLLSIVILLIVVVTRAQGGHI